MHFERRKCVKNAFPAGLCPDPPGRDYSAPADSRLLARFGEGKEKGGKGQEGMEGKGKEVKGWDGREGEVKKKDRKGTDEKGRRRGVGERKERGGR